MLILGLSPFQHDPAAALLESGTVKAAIENDKLVRSHSPGLPEAAIEFCLEGAKAHARSGLEQVGVGGGGGLQRAIHVNGELATGLFPSRDALMPRAIVDVRG